MLQNLLEFDRNAWTVVLNRAWLMMIPEFRTLIQRDKGSPGDYRGDKKLKATREVTYIWLMLDWRSPFFEGMTVEEKEQFSLNATRLSKTDIDPPIQAAFDWYRKLLIENSRSYKTYTKMLLSVDKLDDYYEKVDFVAKDKMGRQAYSITEYLGSIDKAAVAYDRIEAFKKRTIAELTNKISARQNTILGVNEERFAHGDMKFDYKEAAAHDDPIMEQAVNGHSHDPHDIEIDIDDED